MARMHRFAWLAAGALAWLGPWAHDAQAEGTAPAGAAAAPSLRTTLPPDPAAFAPVREARYAPRVPDLSLASVGSTTAAASSAGAQAGGGGGSSSGGGAGDLAKQLSNPIADLISVPIQANLDEGFGQDDDGYRWTLNIQPVIPIKLGCRWNMISRTILPLIVQEGAGPGTQDVEGMGDIVQSFFFSPRGSGSVTWGVGPVFLLPTATDDALGQRQWGVGPTAVVLKQAGPWTVGMLANHIWSVADRDDPLAPDVNATFLQPFVAYTFPSAFTVTVNTESTYDWENDVWNVPINLVLSQVTKICSQPISLGFGLRYWAETPEGGPEWGIRLLVTFIFPAG